jgi:hypothetical protein
MIENSDEARPKETERAFSFLINKMTRFKMRLLGGGEGGGGAGGLI